MENALYLPSGSELFFSSGLPAGYSGTVVPDSISQSACGDFGYLVRQEIATAQCIIRYQVMRFFERMQLRSWIDPPGLLVRLSLNQTVVHHINQQHKLRLKENHFALFHGQQVQTEAIYAAGKEYQTVDIAYAPAMINELLAAFPQWHVFLQRSASKKHFGMLHASRAATDAMVHTMRTILHAVYEREQERDFLDNRVKDYLVMSLEQAQGKVREQLPINAAQREAIAKAQQWITRDITLHHTTVDLARKVQLNEYTFKVLFKQLTGVGSFEYLQQQRLSRAHALLTTSDVPIKVIHAQVGYDSLTGFITGFKKYFGYTPGSLRR